MRPTPEIIRIYRKASRRARPLPDAPDDARLTAFQAVPWNSAFSRGKSINAALDAIQQDDPPRARLVLLGAVEPLPTGDYFFEPEIIPTTRLLGRNVYFAYALAFIAALFGLQHFRVIPRVPIPWQAFGQPITMGLIFVVAWIWRGLLRPTYIRITPGMVEFMCYRWFWHNHAQVRRYPIESGTTIAVCEWVSYSAIWGSGTWDEATHEWRQRGRKRSKTRITSFGFFRGNHQDTIQLGSMSKPDEVMDVLWRAILSRVVLRPMGDDELLG